MPKRIQLLAVVFVALLLLGAPKSEAAVISVGPYTVPAVPGTPFLVPVQVTDAIELLTWGFGLKYDPTDLQINDPGTLDLFGRYTTEGTFGAPFNTVLSTGFIDLDGITFLQTGSLFGVEGAYIGIPPAPSGNGILAFVEFVALGAGDSTITVTDPSVVSTAPEPTPLALLLSGLLLLGGYRLSLGRQRRALSA